jgi:hypothetical protein
MQIKNRLEESKNKGLSLTLLDASVEDEVKIYKMNFRK